MKKNLFSSALFAILFLSVTSAFAATKGFEGVWKFNYSDAPYEYSTGVFKIAADNTIALKFPYQTVEVKDAKVDGKTVKFSIEVDGSTVSIRLVQSDNNGMNAHVSSELGESKIALTKVSDSSTAYCGNYNANISGAPYEFQKGKILITYLGGKYNVEFKSASSGTKTALQQVKKEGKNLSGSLTVEGTEVKITFTENNRGLNCKASFDYEQLSFQAKW